MDSLFSTIFTNKEWLFSGVLVLPLAWIFKSFSFVNFLKPTGPKISGKWRLKYRENGEGHAEFRQIRNRVWGKLVICKSKSGRDINRSFDISGWFVSGRLTATYEDTESRGLVVGAIALELYHDRTKMNGKVIFFGGQGDNPVIDYDITLLWNPA
jgi:hypothetical protein